MILGIQVGITSGCAFYDGGKILFAASEERYSRVKNETDFPVRAIEAGLKHLEITIKEIDRVVFPSQNMSPISYMLKRECSFSIKDYLREQKEYYFQSLIQRKQMIWKDYLSLFPEKHGYAYGYNDLLNRLEENLTKQPFQVWNEWRCDVVESLGVEKEKIEIVNHEYSHAAYGYYGSPFRGDDVLIVTFDGFGDEANATVSIVKEGKLKCLKKYNKFNVGRVYRYITLLLAMKPSEHEYKVMGLAPYASNYIYSESIEVFTKAYAIEEGEIKIDQALKDNFFYFKDALEGQRFDGIAGGLQKWTENMVCGLVNYWLNKTCTSRLVVSGGVSLNIKANMELGKIDEVKDLFVVGSGGDESLCIGAIYAYLDKHNKASKEVEPLLNLYLGDSLLNDEVETALDDIEEKGGFIVHRNCSIQTVAQYLASGKILARISGRMEFGARSLGNRSILADPRNSETLQKINSQIKNRDFWMPFTPSILDIDAERYLVNPKGFLFPYMTIASETTDEGKESLKSALHPADKTARPQIVTEYMNYGYYKLIEAFKKETGVGALLNTSLNLHGSPIARSARDACQVMFNSQLDGMILGSNLILRMEQ